MTEITANLAQRTESQQRFEDVLGQTCFAAYRDLGTDEFDVIDAAAVLDRKHRSMIAEWVMGPFWP